MGLLSHLHLHNVQHILDWKCHNGFGQSIRCVVKLEAANLTNHINIIQLDVLVIVLTLAAHCSPATRIAQAAPCRSDVACCEHRFSMGSPMVRCHRGPTNPPPQAPIIQPNGPMPQRSNKSPTPKNSILFTLAPIILRRNHEPLWQAQLRFSPWIA